MIAVTMAGSVLKAKWRCPSSSRISALGMAAAGRGAAAQRPRRPSRSRSRCHHQRPLPHPLRAQLRSHLRRRVDRDDRGRPSPPGRPGGRHPTAPGRSSVAATPPAHFTPSRLAACTTRESRRHRPDHSGAAARGSCRSQVVATWSMVASSRPTSCPQEPRLSRATSPS